jgi:RimJ/RimL family protein N-acetyltransferase
MMIESSETNSLGQPIGFAVPGWKPAQFPPHQPMEGRFCRIEPLDPDRHAADLHAANELDVGGGMWTYLGYGPFESAAAYRAWLSEASRRGDALFFAIVDKSTGRAAGVAGYLRIDLQMGTVEVGHLAYSPLLRRTPAATEAMCLLMERAFQLGFRRYEWKCDSLNAPSRAAAQRLGFSFEGVFRQAAVVKGRNRDTAWYAVTNRDWPALKEAFQRWLDPSNFDGQGRQRLRLSVLTGLILKR